MDTIRTNYTMQDKEQVILSTIISCNRELKNFQKKCNINLFGESKLDKYHYKMLNLFSVVTGEPLNVLNESISSLLESNNFVKPNPHGNYYAYFQKVNEFLNGYESGIQHSLNESILTLSSIPLDKQTANFQQNTNIKLLSIDTFKADLKRYIEILRTNDDFEKYVSDDILKIKIFSKRPIFVYGFDIINNFIFQKEISERFKKNPNSILSICYDKGMKRLFFVFDEIIAYDIETDTLDLLKKIDSSYDIPRYDKTNYFTILKDSISKALIEIYMNTSMQDFSFKDNLYNDVVRSVAGKNEIAKLEPNNIFGILK